MGAASTRRRRRSSVCIEEASAAREAYNSRTAGLTSIEPGELGCSALFGVSISEAVLGAVGDALAWLETNHLGSEGLWRKPGSKRDAQELEAQADRLGWFPLDTVSNEHTLVSCLVSLLRKVPGGVLSEATVDKLLTAAANNPNASAEEYTEVIRSREGAGTACVLWFRLIEHWKMVIANPDNKMGASAMATCVFALASPSKDDMGLQPVMETILVDDERKHGATRRGVREDAGVLGNGTSQVLTPGSARGSAVTARASAEPESTRRQAALRTVYQQFDLDGSGAVGGDELMEIGRARRRLGQKKGEWTKAANQNLMKKIGADQFGNVTEAQFVSYFDHVLSTERSEFDKAIEQFLAVANSCSQAKRSVTPTKDRFDSRAGKTEHTTRSRGSSSEVTDWGDLANHKHEDGNIVDEIITKQDATERDWEAERAVLVEENNQLGDENAELMDQVAELADKYSEVVNEKAALVEAEQEWEAERGALVAENQQTQNAASAAMEKLRDENARLSHELAELADEVVQLADERAELEAEMKQHATEWEAERAVLVEENNQLGDENAELMDQVAELADKYSEVVNEKAALVEAEQEWEAERGALVAENQQTQNAASAAMEKLRDENARLSHELAELADEVVQLADERAELEAEMKQHATEWEAERAVLVEENNQLGDENAELMDQVAELADKYREMVNEKAALIDENDRALNEEHQVATFRHTALTEESAQLIDGLCQQLEAVKLDRAEHAVRSKWKHMCSALTATTHSRWMRLLREVARATRDRLIQQRSRVELNELGVKYIEHAGEAERVSREYAALKVRYSEMEKAEQENRHLAEANRKFHTLLSELECTLQAGGQVMDDKLQSSNKVREEHVTRPPRFDVVTDVSSPSAARIEYKELMDAARVLKLHESLGASGIGFYETPFKEDRLIQLRFMVTNAQKMHEEEFVCSIHEDE